VLRQSHAMVQSGPSWVFALKAPYNDSILLHFTRVKEIDRERARQF
jgi:hypothetical protein